MISYSAWFSQPGRESRFEVRGALANETQVAKINSLPPAEDETGAVDGQLGIVWQSRYGGSKPEGADHPPIVYDVRWNADDSRGIRSVPAMQLTAVGGSARV